jgi:2-methylisocitrate lyase-like PEP mutase family enzyme
MSANERSRILKSRVAEGRAILLPGVANALGARIAEDLGYEALYLTGAGISNTTLGLPDLGLITLDNIIDTISHISNVVDLPLVVDADTGFGNAVNVHNTVRRLEAAGASAIQLEDQVFPKKCGHFEGKDVISAAEMVDKVKAAVDARRSSDTLIIARTDARYTEGFEAAMARAQAYIDAGADVTFVEAVTSQEEIAAVPARLKRPQVINIVYGGKTPPLPFETLDEMGFSFVLYANAALQAAISAMQSVLGDLKANGSLAGAEDRLASFVERQRVVRKGVYDDLERRFAGAEES